jgi:hypothetical protein
MLQIVFQPGALLKGPKRSKSLDPTLPTTLVTGYSDVAGRLWTTPSPRLMSSDFHLCGPLKKHLAGKRFVIDADMKQAVTSWPQHLALVSSTLGYKTWCHGRMNA